MTCIRLRMGNPSFTPGYQGKFGQIHPRFNINILYPPRATNHFINEIFYELLQKHYVYSKNRISRRVPFQYRLDRYCCISKLAHFIFFQLARRNVVKYIHKHAFPALPFAGAIKREGWRKLTDHSMNANKGRPPGTKFTT